MRLSDRPWHLDSSGAEQACKAIKGLQPGANSDREAEAKALVLGSRFLPHMRGARDKCGFRHALAVERVHRPAEMCH